MKLQSIEFENFRGGTEKHELTGFDVFIGPNGSGKSRVLDAVQLTIKGSVSDPTSPKNIDEMDLISKRFAISNMRIVATFEGASVDRIFAVGSKNGKASLNQRIDVLPGKPMGVSDATRAVQGLIGDFTPMLNVAEFIRLSDEKRAEMLFTFCRPEQNKWSPSAIVKKLIDGAPKGADGERVRQKCLGMEKHLGEDIQTGIEDAIAHLGSEVSALTKSRRGSASVAETAFGMNQADGKSSMRHAADIKAELEEAGRQHIELVEARSRAESAKLSIERHRTDVVSLKKQIAEVGSDEKKKALKSLKDSITRIQLADLEDLRNECNELNEKVFALSIRKESLVKEATSMEERVAIDTRNLRLIERGTCPTCGQDVISATDNLRDSITYQEIELKSKQLEFDAVRNLIEEFNGKIKLTESNLRGIERANAIKLVDRSRMETSIAKIEGEMTSVKQMDDRLRLLEKKKIAGTEDAMNLEQAAMQIDGLKTRIKALEDELRIRRDHDAKIEIAKGAALNAKRDEEDLTVLKSFVSTLQDIRRSILKEALLPIEGEASELLKEMGGARFAIRHEDERGNQMIEIGWRIEDELGPRFLPFAALSTAQKIFTIVAVLSPLIHRANPKFRILLLDDCEHIDRENRLGFIKMLGAAKERFLDNVLIGSSSDWWGNATYLQKHALKGRKS